MKQEKTTENNTKHNNYSNQIDNYKNQNSTNNFVRTKLFSTKYLKEVEIFAQVTNKKIIFVIIKREIMEIEFIKANASRTKPKATIHMTGKLGFNIEASNLIGLGDKKAFLIGRDKKDDNKIYLFESDAEGSAKVAKAGLYYYINAGNVFDVMELDYKKYTIMFDIAKDSYNNQDIYVLTKRTPKERNFKQSL